MTQAEPSKELRRVHTSAKAQQSPDISHMKTPEFYPWEINQNVRNLTVLKVQYVNRSEETRATANCCLL